MIPNITYDFNFDYILILIFTSYIIYGYFSGGHKQIRLSLNLIVPFMAIYYLGKYITAYMYIPLKSTLLFQMFDTYLGIVKNTFGMMVAYIITYFVLFGAIFVLSIYAKRYILNDNMRAKLGRKNNYLGAIFALLNGYVLIYFIILPAFSLNIIDGEARMTTYVLKNPPPFSRIARTAEKAVPIKGLADKAEAFQQLVSVDGIEGYYNDAIYDYQQLYIGNESYETEFMETVYIELSSDAQVLLNDEYFDYFGEELTVLNYRGISRILILKTVTNDYLYLDVIEIEKEFETTLAEMKTISADYRASIIKYEKDVRYYAYGVQYDAYSDSLDNYEAVVISYSTTKVATLLAGNHFTDVLGETRPTMGLEEPDNYIHPNILVEPVEPVAIATITEADDFVVKYEDKIDVRPLLTILGQNFENHKGLLVWYIDELDRNMTSSSSGGDISEIIVSFKINYESIMGDINDDELEEKLYLAQMSILSYDIFTIWLDCTMANMETIDQDDIGLEANRCINIDTSSVTEYDFTEDALNIGKQLFEGESVAWIILQFKYDYEAGGFQDEFVDFPEVLDVLASTKELVDDYDEYYKHIANSLEGNLSMAIKIGISVMKYHLDVYDTLSDSPIMAAVFNDAVRVCSGSTTSPINRDVMVCPVPEGDRGIMAELMNSRFLASEILFKAYLMVDNENEAIIYDTDKMNELLTKANGAVESNVISGEVVRMFGDQLAFNVIDSTNNYTLLEQMYDDGQITIEAMRILADDEHELFSEEFRARVRSLIR
ncbi:MAG: CvpA family protein [Candidatus Izimaplasma sp.]|nr:CvpA family protein [Candidatus Izimaplasma bacterium]